MALSPGGHRPLLASADAPPGVSGACMVTSEGWSRSRSIATWCCFGGALTLSQGFNGALSSTFFAAGFVLLCWAWLLMALSSRREQALALPLALLPAAVAAYAAWLAVGTLLSAAPSVSAETLREASLVAVVFAVLAVHPERENTWRHSVWATLTVTLVWTGYAAWQYFYLRQLPTVFMPQANAWAGFLLPLAFILISRLGSLPAGWRNSAWLLWLGLAWVGYSMGLTGSRGAFLACATACVLLAGAGVLMRAWQKAAAAAAVLLLAFVAGGQSASLLPATSMGGTQPSLAASQSATSIDPRFGALSSRFGEFRNNNPLGPRLIMWQSAFRMIEGNPWYGSGLGTFWLEYPPYRSPLDDSAGFHAHNDFLEIAAELGYPGLALLLLLLAGAGEAAWRAVRAERKSWLEPTALAAGALAIYVHMLVDFNFHNMSVLLVFALLLGRLHQLADRARPYRQWSPGRWLPARSAVVLACLAIAAIGFAYFRQGTAAQHMDKAQAALSRGDTSQADALLEQAVRDDPASEIALLMRCDLYRRLAQTVPEQAVARRRELALKGIDFTVAARDLNPLRAETYLFEGDFQALLVGTEGAPAVGRALAAYRAALARDPRLLSARIALMQALDGLGDQPGAAAVAEAGLAEAYPLSDRASWMQYMLLATRERLATGNHSGAEELAGKLDQALVASGRPAAVLQELQSMATPGDR